MSKGWQFEASLGRKICENPSQSTAGCGGTQLLSQAMQEAESGRTRILGQPRQKSLQDPISME
jgi:hypothetical protein